ncbi:hypothetical protein B1R32_10537 [Abditibacterium utsteinense]|uniref:Uncharacterized protein n=1 Tax=Abditibacterium utsteinense TaxID=1960156 RepID=A0A2S8SU82_9BACT|nr:hypothetical protein [Abditibacterium utsteinense]PQV64356.1 hypothetical protein B1R32_10537 [Abditibacterium utsteinense]
MQTPQNPYSNPSGFNQPPSMPGALPPRGQEISFDAIGQAWKVLQPNLGTWIGAALIYGIITILLQVLQGVMIPKNANGAPQIGLTYWILVFIGFVVGQFIIGGMMRMAINNVRTGRAELGQMFSTTDVLPSLLGAGILTTLLSGIGYLLCIVPGLLLSGLFMFVMPLIVDKRQGAIEAIGNSFNALKPQMWMALLFVIVIGLVAGAGALACGVGLLVTAPLALIAIAITYNNLLGGGQNAAQPPMPPSAPIANPFN